MSDNVEHIKLYEPNIHFCNCQCKDQDKIAYSIKHIPRPLLIPAKLKDAIEILMWYTPNVITSEQSEKNEYLKEILFEDAVMTYFINRTKLRSEDIYFAPDSKLSAEYVMPYTKMICNSCQKILVTKKKCKNLNKSKNENETKITCILRHLRNCIAHGHFNIVNNSIFIGFDKGKENGIETTTAIFKMDMQSVYNFCQQLIQFPDFTISQIFLYALLKDGYTCFLWMDYKNEKEEEICIAQKNQTFYRINVTRYRTASWDSVDITEKENAPKLDKDVNERAYYINIFYSETHQSRMEKISDNYYIMGKSGLKALFTGNMLKELLDQCPVTEKK